MLTTISQKMMNDIVPENFLEKKRLFSQKPIPFATPCIEGGFQAIQSQDLSVQIPVIKLYRDLSNPRLAEEFRSYLLDLVANHEGELTDKSIATLRVLAGERFKKIKMKS